MRPLPHAVSALWQSYYRKTENSAFFATKMTFLSPFLTSVGTWPRDNLSYTLLQVLRKLYTQRASSLFAISFLEVKKAPKMAPKMAKKPTFYYIYLYKSIYQFSLTFKTICTPCNFLCSFTSTIQTKLNIRTFLSGSIYMPKNWNGAPKKPPFWLPWSQNGCKSIKASGFVIPVKNAILYWAQVWLYHSYWQNRAVFTTTGEHVGWFHYKNCSSPWLRKHILEGKISQFRWNKNWSRYINTNEHLHFSQIEKKYTGEKVINVLVLKITKRAKNSLFLVIITSIFRIFVKSFGASQYFG